jgi:acyl-CoA thioester hydrolase
MKNPIPIPFSVACERVRKEWIDYNGHLNVGYYHVAFDLAADQFFDFLGLTAQFRAHHEASTFALESHLNFLREVKEGDPLRFEARLIDFDAKRIHFYMEMFHADDGFVAASYESLSAYVSMTTRRTAPMPAELLCSIGGREGCTRLAASAVAARPRDLGAATSEERDE